LSEETQSGAASDASRIACAPLAGWDCIPDPGSNRACSRICDTVPAVMCKDNSLIRELPFFIVASQITTNKTIKFRVSEILRRKH
jgi:hypothetical protein